MVLIYNDLLVQKQSLKGVPRNKCSKNIQQIYRRTPIPKRDFNKAALLHYWNRPSLWVFSCEFAAYFQNTFSGLLLLVHNQKYHPVVVIWPIFGQCSFLIPRENTRKPLFLLFSGGVEWKHLPEMG